MVGENTTWWDETILPVCSAGNRWFCDPCFLLCHSNATSQNYYESFTCSKLYMPRLDFHDVVLLVSKHLTVRNQYNKIYCAPWPILKRIKLLFRVNLSILSFILRYNKKQMVQCCTILQLFCILMKYIKTISTSQGITLGTTDIFVAGFDFTDINFIQKHTKLKSVLIHVGTNESYTIKCKLCSLNFKTAALKQSVVDIFLRF